MKAKRLRPLGAVAVEFAIVLVLMLTVVFATIEFGRAMFVWSSAVDATRRGARMAAIAEMGDSARVIAAMNLGLAGLPEDKVTIEYSPDGIQFGQPNELCTGRGSCEFVRVAIAGYTFTPWLPFVPSPIPMPAFSTTLPVEALGAT